MTRSIFPSGILLLATITAVQAQAPSQPTAQPEAAQSAAAKVLLDQATFWRSQNRLDDAQSAVERLLRLEPDNAAGLGVEAELQAERGDRAGAQATLARLRAVRPDDAHIAAAEQALRQGSIDPTGLAEARRLAGEGRSADAVTAYQRLFHGSAPPNAMAVEYYTTLAGAEGGWDQARAGLARIVAASPHEQRAQLAYAQLLTYREQTRAEGLARLAILAKNPETASAAAKAWRQALDWLPIDSASIPVYQAWLTLHPDDNTITVRLSQARNPPQNPADKVAAQRSAGFTALNSGRLKDAETAFRGVLQNNPQDADALGGLGLVRLRQGNAADAHDLLARAMAADPAHKARWEQALAGASIGDEYATARSAIQRGQLDVAERQLRAIIAQGGDVVGAQAMLADVLSRRGDLAGAETQYRAVVVRQLANTDALVGLAQVLGREGREGEADTLLERAQGLGSGRVAGRIRGDALRQQASATHNPAAKEALLRAAVAANPGDPWTRLDLARALAATGRKAEARAVMAEVTGSPNPGADALRASALFAAEDGRPADAAALVERLPASARSADMRALLAQTHLQTEIRSAAALGAVSPAEAREKLLVLAAQPDPDGARGVAVARAFLQMGDAAGAREALATAQAATRSPTPAQRIAYAGMLLQAGDDRGSQILIHSLDGAAGLTAQQTADLNRLRTGAAIRESDALNEEGRQADAYDALAPALTRTPDDPDLNMAVARLYARADQPNKAVAINDALLARDPDNLDARRAAVGSAIQARDWTRAENLVREGLSLAPDDPRTWLMSAELNRARGNDRRALADLRKAQALRQQQIGADRSPAFRSSDATSVRTSTANELAMVSAVDDPLPPADGNPFRRGGETTTGPNTSASPLSGATPADPILQDIGQQIVSVQDDLAPKLSLGPFLRSRTGTSGLDQLDEVSTPLQLLARPLGEGQLTVVASPTFLSAGSVPADTQSQASFGTGAFGGRSVPPSQHAEGVGFSAGYQIGWAKADVGVSPVGFQQQKMLGGVELSPEIADGVRLRLLGERRAVTDSVLSYAGTRDPGTGIPWGGVTRTRGHAQLEFSVQDTNFYVGGGYAALNGENVASNTEYEFGAGGSTQVWHGHGDDVRVGLDLVYFGYDKNLRYFTLGQGGYFSPQSYFATLIPVHYSSHSNNLTWSIGGSVGYQTYQEHDSAVFPNDPGMQAGLVASAAGNPNLLTVHPGDTASGLVGNADGSVEYRLSDTVRIGGHASYQHAGNWSEAIGTLFARYIFTGDGR